MSSCISIQGIEMRFRGCEALQGVNLEVPTGSVFALLGENGAGKTTLIRILTGFQKPTRGQRTVCGLDPAVDALEIRRRVGYVSDMRVQQGCWRTIIFHSPVLRTRFPGVAFRSLRSLHSTPG